MVSQRSNGRRTETLQVAASVSFWTRARDPGPFTPRRAAHCAQDSRAGVLGGPHWTTWECPREARPGGRSLSLSLASGLGWARWAWMGCARQLCSTRAMTAGEPGVGGDGSKSAPGRVRSLLHWQRRASWNGGWPLGPTPAIDVNSPRLPFNQFARVEPGLAWLLCGSRGGLDHSLAECGEARVRVRVDVEVSWMDGRAGRRPVRLLSARRKKKALDRGESERQKGTRCRGWLFCCGVVELRNIRHRRGCTRGGVCG